MEIEPSKRLNFETLKQQEWFAGMNWEDLENKRVTPPFQPDQVRIYIYIYIFFFDQELVILKSNNIILILHKIILSMSIYYWHILHIYIFLILF